MREVGRYCDNGSIGEYDFDFEAHTTVGKYLPNAWGLYDMHGNVSEWCLDWYQENLGSRSVTDPKGPSGGNDRVLRGGCWYNSPKNCRSACRVDRESSDGYSHYYYDYYGFGCRGFRVVLVQ